MIKKLIRTVLLVALLSTTTLHAWAEDVNRQALQALAMSDWFKFRSIYNTNRDNLSPEYADLFKAMLDMTFNHPDSAIASTKALLRNHGKEFDDQTKFGFVALMARAYGIKGQYGEVAKLLESVADKSNKSGGDTQKAAQAMQRIANVLKTTDVNQLVGTKPYTMKFSLDSVGPATSRGVAIRIDGSLDGKPTRMTFDTGAGVNVITPEFAKELNLEIHNIQAAAEGVGGRVNAQLAIANELHLGNLTVHNVPFYVIDLTTSNDTVNKYLKTFNCIVGLPVMKALGEMQLDFANGTITVPSTDTESDVRNLALSMKDMQLMLQAENREDTIVSVLDTGYSGYGQLGHNYFKTHKKQVKESGKLQKHGAGGAGGVVYSKGYTLPDFVITIAGNSQNIPKMQVLASKNGNNDHNTLGAPTLCLFNKVIINLNKMFLLAQ